MVKTAFENLLFACRWLLAPFYVALVVALAALIFKVVTRAYGLALQVETLSEADVILGALGVVDLTLTACLVVRVVFSTYANFVARVEAARHADWPTWMIAIDYGELKLKLVASIVAIAAIRLLEAFMNVDHQLTRDLAWQTGIFGAFVGAALLLAVAESLGRSHANHAD